MITLLVSTGVTKYNVGKPSTPLVLPEGKRILLVPGQVETDASIRFGSPRWRTNLELLQQVRADNPNAFIIYKPHPDVLAGGRAGKTHTAKRGAVLQPAGYRGWHGGTLGACKRGPYADFVGGF